jgi:hypothetical protein
VRQSIDLNITGEVKLPELIVSTDDLETAAQIWGYDRRCGPARILVAAEPSARRS